MTRGRSCGNKDRFFRRSSYAFRASASDVSLGGGDTEPSLLLETPTGTTVSNRASSSSLPVTGIKLADVNSQVTHPIRLLQENVMMELYQEQLRTPSPVHPSQKNRSKRSQSHTPGITTTRASISSLVATPRPSVILYEPKLGVQTPPIHRSSLLSVEIEHEPRASLLYPSSNTGVSASDAVTLRASTGARAVVTPASSTRAVASGTSTTMETNDTHKRECLICFEKLDPLQVHGCVSCDGAFCSTCMQWYVEYKILDGEVSSTKLVCPTTDCSRPLTEELIEAFASPDTFTKYKTFLRNQKAGVRFCPRAGCCAVIEEPLFCKSRKVKCTECNTESCMRCGGDYHRTRLCRKVDKRYGKWKRHHDVRACPSCKSDIEKQGGCCHMKCLQCDQEFCWSCLRPWGDHDETLCIPLSFYHSKSRKYGWTTPVRFVTKSVVVGVAGVVAIAGAGVAVVVLPPLMGYHLVKDSYRKNKYQRSSYPLYMPESVPQTQN
uniref:RBR-type E3 ubiquitin transferase n=1 Tax=Globisporangium ultimum (strain ATCC 200006 / CBS 805.95 / DAOM BR144) TaxID=431595 RepID=K3WPW8_GLOUD